MPSAIAPVDPRILQADLSSDLEGTVDPPSTAASRVLDGPPVGLGSPALPGVVQLPRPVVRAPIHDHVWLDRIHVIPRTLDLGAVLSDQLVSVEVWNAFLRRARIVTSVVVTGPAGVELDSPPATPTHFPGSDSRMYIVRILGQGDPRIDNRVTWNFTGIDPSGTDLAILGFRVLPFSVMADGAGRVVERYGYLTDVIVARDGTEQRVRLRAVPRGSIEYELTCVDPRDSQLVNALIYGFQSRPCGVPLWHYASRLTAQATAGTVNVPVPTTDVPWAVKSLVFLWRDPMTWEVGRVSAIAPSALTVELALQSTWLATLTWAMPLVIGRLSEEESFQWAALRTGRSRLRFDVDGFLP